MTSKTAARQNARIRYPRRRRLIRDFQPARALPYSEATLPYSNVYIRQKSVLEVKCMHTYTGVYIPHARLPLAMHTMESLQVETTLPRVDGGWGAWGYLAAATALEVGTRTIAATLM